MALFLMLLMLGDRHTDPPRAVPDPTRLGIPFQRYTTRDEYDRTVTFYLSIPPKTEKPDVLPIALIIGGSGCQSLFSKQGDRIAGGYQNLLLMEEKGRARVLVVEKPDDAERRVDSFDRIQRIDRSFRCPSVMFAIWMV